MSQLAILFAIFTCVFLSIAILECQFGFRKIKNISLQTDTLNTSPRVSIIFSALNEQTKISDTLASLLKLDYPNYEVIAINDRSSDNTASLMNAVAAKNKNLTVKHIASLPQGWMGKNHALHQGSEVATGDWLLFTDADVLMDPCILRKTLSYAIDNKLDHLTLYEGHSEKGFGQNVFLLINFMMQSIVLKPWAIQNPNSKKYHGNGAFNLVKKSAYKQCGGHANMAMKCLDDLHLGKLIKTSNLSQDIADGQDLISREWYSSLKEMIHGLQKNAFAFFNYNLSLTLLSILGLSLLIYLPFLTFIFAHGALQVISGINIGLTILLSFLLTRQFRLQTKIAFFYPLSAAFLLYTICKSIGKIYRNKGVVWRGTLYSLTELKK